MLRVNFYLTEKQISFLEKLDDLSVSEHIRRAIDQYTENIKTILYSASASKEGEKDD